MKQPLILLALLTASLSVHSRTVTQSPPDTLTVRTTSGTVDERRMNKGLVNNALDAISGQTAGVNVSSSGADRMAMLSAVRVRGTTSLTGGNDPLVIIDGVSSDLATLSTIYPADIERFTILKNASETARYGSRGAAGVIQVDTKRGQGGKFRIAYDGNIGFETAYRNIRMLSRNGYLAAAQQYHYTVPDGGYNTDFLDAVTRTGTVQHHHIAFSGGTDQSNYRASIGYMQHNRVVKTNDYSNFVAKFDLNQHAFNDFLQIDFGVFGSSRKSHDLFDVHKLFYSAATMNPTFAFTPIDADWQKNSNASQINPPDALLHEKNDERNLNFNTHLQLTLHPLTSLTLTFFGSYSHSSTENGQFCPTWVWAQGQAYRGEHKREDWLGNITLNYQHTIGMHHLDATLLAEYQKTNLTGFWTLVKGFNTNDFGYNRLGAGSIRPYGGTDSYTEAPALASLMGNVAYTLLSRYTLTLSTRADGSSMVGRNNTWGFFPSISAEWDVMKEGWIPRSNIINQLKIRTGYGRSGNLGGIESYNSMEVVMPNGIVPYQGSPTVTMGIARNANPDLKWETRSTFNIGAEMVLLNNRIALTAEYYYAKTTDMLYLYDVPVPPFTYDKLLANLGSMSNSGLELGLALTPIKKKDLQLDLNINLSFQRNKLISLSGQYKGRHMSASDITPIGTLYGAGFHGGNNNILYQIVGESLGVFYLPHCTGIVTNSSGNKVYQIADLNHDGEISLDDNGGDRYVAGQATPKMTLGSNIALRYKDFDVSVQINGAFGHKIYNGTSLSYMNMSSFPDYNVMASAPAHNIKDQNATDYWLESGDYVNIDYLTLGWNIPIHSPYISSMRLSLSVNNLATITGYSGLTPMINSYIVNGTMGIDDKRSYPPYRSYSLGISIAF